MHQWNGKVGFNFCLLFTPILGDAAATSLVAPVSQRIIYTFQITLVGGGGCLPGKSALEKILTGSLRIFEGLQGPAKDL